MIIGVDASRANRKKKTGVEWYAYYLIEELKKITADNENQFFLYTDKPLRGELARLPKNWQEKILRWPPRYLWTKLRFSWEMLRRKIDILFIPSHVMPSFSPKKTVMTVHDLGYERYPEAYSKFARRYLRKSYCRAVHRAAQIIVPTEFTKKELITLYNAQSEKIEVVNLAFDNNVFKPIVDQEKINKTLERYKIKKPFLLYVGRLETKKGLQTLLKSFKELGITNNKLSLALIGGKGFGYKKIKPMINNSKLMIHELGHLQSDEDRSIFYSNAEVFIFPSLYEGFGIPILEAMACGCPVIASNIEALKEVGEESVLFFKVDNSEDLTEKTKEVLENQELRQKMIASGLERVKNFSWHACAKKTLEILVYDL